MGAFGFWAENQESCYSYTMGEVQSAPSVSSSVRYFQIPAKIYQPGERIAEDLYLYYQGQYLLFRPKGFVWLQEDVQKLESFGTSHLHVIFDSDSDHHEFLESNLIRVMRESRATDSQKSKILYEASSTLLEGIFKNPESPEALRRSVKLVETSIDFLAKRENFIELMKLASANFSEYTHALHSAAYAITLTKELGVKQYDQLIGVGVGSILHDIGKIKIDAAIRDKQGELDEDERREMEKHPLYGYEIVRKSGSLPELAEKVILMHHERPNGQGYPYRLSGDFLILAKVVGICDCFDSLTSDRVYQEARSPMNSLRMMQVELSGEYDQKVLTTFIKMLAGR
jgi:HD-GYP domain-containing protein (c-di-GMP phosphodiesterase class II)